MWQIDKSNTSDCFKIVVIRTDIGLEVVQHSKGMMSVLTVEQ